MLSYSYSQEKKDTQLITKAAKIHDRILTVDSHCDTPLRFLRTEYNLSQRHDPHQDGSKVDLPRMKEGGLDAIFFAAFVGQGPRDAAGNEKAKALVLRTIHVIHDSIRQHPDLANLAASPEDAYRLAKAGKRAIFIGIENGYAIGNDLTMIQKYYDLGVRYMTLCHTNNNDICDSSTDSLEHNGLSEFGKEVVAEMNRVGMMIDVSHISDQAFRDVVQLSCAPVIASHSCARAICDHPRNLSDELLVKLAQNGGVIQMCIMSAYVKPEAPNPQRDSAFAQLREKYRFWDQMSAAEQQELRQQRRALDKQFPQQLATVADVVDHIDHIVRVAGIDHVGIGTDFDGGGGVTGCYDVSEMGNITLELVRRGYSEKQIQKIWGGNLMRVMREVRKQAERLARARGEN
jgi:membrane dipeptidase